MFTLDPVRVLLVDCDGVAKFGRPGLGPGLGGGLLAFSPVAVIFRRLWHVCDQLSPLLAPTINTRYPNGPAPRKPAQLGCSRSLGVGGAPKYMTRATPWTRFTGVEMNPDS